MILKRDLFLMQDDPENGRCWIGTPLGNAESLTHSQIGELLKASEAIEFAGQTRAEVYAWVQKTLVAPEYGRQAKKTKGAIRAYLSKVTGLSLPQIARTSG